MFAVAQRIHFNRQGEAPNFWNWSIKRSWGTPGHPTRDRGSYSGHSSFMKISDVFGTKPQTENKEKSMPLVLTSLVDKDIIDFLEETWKRKIRKTKKS